MEDMDEWMVHSMALHSMVHGWNGIIENVAYCSLDI